MKIKKFSYATLTLLAAILVAPLLLTACGPSVAATVDDPTITAQVKTSLLNDKDVGGLRIVVDTFNGVVTLSGAVKTPVERDKAVGLAQKVAGVKDVKSTLQIVP